MLRTPFSLIVLLGTCTLAAQAASYNVTKSNDDGSQGTLRKALESAESDGQASEITFAVNDVWLDGSRNALPNLSAGNLTIRGNTAPAGKVTIHFGGITRLYGITIKSASNTLVNVVIDQSVNAV